MATQNEILQVRRRIGDRAKQATETLEYIGSDVVQLKFRNIYGLTIVLNEQPLSPDQFSINSLAGSFTLPEDLASQDDTMTITYTYAAYTDAEIAAMIDAYGEKGAVVEIINELLADSAKMFDYSEAGTETKQSQIFSQLKQLLNLYQNSDGTVKVDPAENAGFGTMNRDFGQTHSFDEYDISRQDC